MDQELGPAPADDDLATGRHPHGAVADEMRRSAAVALVEVLGRAELGRATSRRAVDALVVVAHPQSLVRLRELSVTASNAIVRERAGEAERRVQRAARRAR